MWSGLADRLAGRIVVLEPIAPEHEEGLWEASQDHRIWEATNNLVASRDDFRAWWEDALDEQRRGVAAPFATIEASSGRPVGSTRFGTLRPEHRSVEIGWTWLNPRVWKTGANVEAKYLMLRRAFEELGCIRVEFKTSARNARSRAALEALPARFEGVHRKHMIVRDGELRDSAWYSVLDDEWPGVKERLEARLASKLG
jgi:RimJ/RimL family protein N-acetyltransferase